jgi:hypothetical protein
MMGYDNTKETTKGIMMKKPVEAKVDTKFADKAGIKQSVAKEFHAADVKAGTSGKVNKSKK